MTTIADHYFKPYPWQVAEWQIFQRLYDSNRMPHALLLSGAAEIGKRHFSIAMIARLLCQQPVAGYACSNCKACTLFAGGSHPDFFMAEPADPGKSISVDTIRGISEFAGKTAMLGGWRVVLVDPAEAMTNSAANALLKTLEEPGDKTLITLVHHQRSELLATIRSRCRLFAFSMPANNLVIDWLKESCRAEDYGYLLNLAGRRPLRAARFVNEDLLEQVIHVEQTMDKVATGDLSPVAAAEQCKTIPVESFVEWVQNYHARAIVSKGKKNLTLNRTEFHFCDHLIFARRQLAGKTNPNPQLLMEDLLFNWLKSQSVSR